MRFASPGFLILGIWLILTGLIEVAGISFAQREIVLGVLAIIAGALILIGR